MRKHAVLQILACLCTFACLGEPAMAEDWPCWRGPRGDGTSLEKSIPTRWNGAADDEAGKKANENIAWKVPIPGRGHASPIVWRDRIFLVSCLEETDDRVLICLDRSTGRKLWQQTVVSTPLEKEHRLNSRASSTPATDGQRVYVSFLESHPERKLPRANDNPDRVTPGTMLIVAYDLDGRRLWTARPGEFYSRHGYCSSVVLFENLVIVNGDHDGDAYLVALDRETGKTVWKTPRENKTRSYCTPIIRQIDGRTQMILSGSLCVASYDPRDGSRHWIIDGPTEQYVASLVYNGELLFMTAGFPEFHIMAIRPDGHGNVTNTHVAWRTTKGCAYVPSPIVGGRGKYFLLASDLGICSLFEASSGKRHWMERIGPHYSSSPVSADGLVHFLSDKGVTTIIRPGEKFDVVAVNSLGENCYASPTISHGQIFIRAEKHLYCIGPSHPPLLNDKAAL